MTKTTRRDRRTKRMVEMSRMPRCRPAQHETCRCCWQMSRVNCEPLLLRRCCTVAKTTPNCGSMQWPPSRPVHDPAVGVLVRCAAAAATPRPPEGVEGEQQESRCAQPSGAWRMTKVTNISALRRAATPRPTEGVEGEPQVSRRVRPPPAGDAEGPPRPVPQDGRRRQIVPPKLRPVTCTMRATTPAQPAEATKTSTTRRPDCGNRPSARRRSGPRTGRPAC